VDTPQFITEMVKALAWPAVVLIGLVVLRKHLNELLPLLSRLKYHDIEIEFGKKLSELSETVGEIKERVSAIQTEYRQLAEAVDTSSPAKMLKLSGPPLVLAAGEVSCRIQALEW
jgi:hypothetical protein